MNSIIRCRARVRRGQAWIEVDLGAGDDLLTVGSGVMGIYAFGGEGNDTLIGGDGNDISAAAGEEHSLRPQRRPT
jgi:Ca2+-binding RTX toxin-like protein